MVRGLVVPARIERPVTVRDLEGLADYQTVVGGYVEPVEVARLGLTLYANEEGLLRQFEFNSRASFLWWFHAPEARQRAMLVGDVVVVGAPDLAGESTDVPQEVVDLLTSSGTFRIDGLWERGGEWIDYGVRYDDYFDALFWAMIINERTSPLEIKVVGYLEAGSTTTQAE